MKILNWLNSKVSKNCMKSSGCAAILAGSLAFCGTTSADIVLSESFEGGTTGNWSNGYGTYASGQNYSGSDHSLISGGGSNYSHLIGITDTITNQDFDLSATLSAGTFSQIDLGTAIWGFDGWLASYTGDTDIAIFSVAFYDGDPNGLGTNLLATIEMANGGNSTGVTEVINGSTLEAGSANWNADNWSHYVTSGSVPVGSRFARIIYDGSTTTTSNSNDAYAESIQFSINTAIPEPNSAIFLGVGLFGLMGFRRRKK